jgi:hypothetical protein
MANLDEFELDILKSVESGEWESKGNITKGATLKTLNLF